MGVLSETPASPASPAPLRCIACLDIDIKDDVFGDVWLLENFDRLPRTRTHVTRSGGFHLLFCSGEVIRNSSGRRIARGIDVRGEGGYIVWWPAHGCDVLRDIPLDQLPEWPEWLLCRGAGVAGVAGVSDRGIGGTKAEGRGYALAALRNAGRRVSTAPNGERNDTLNAECFAIARFVAAGSLSQEEVADTMAVAARLARLEEREIAATIASAFTGRRRVA